MASGRDTLRIYGTLVRAKIRSDWQYRGSFLLFLASQALVAGLDLAVIFVLFTNVTTLGGWSRPQILLLYAISGVAFGLGDLFASQVETASVHIKAGTFDQFLLRPMGPLIQLSAHEFAFRRLGRMIQPLVVLVVVAATIDVAWTPVKVLLIPVSIASGAAIFGAIWVLTSSIMFWTVDSQEVANSFTYGGSFVTQYPFDVLAPWLRRIVTFLVPLAFVCYFPVAYITDEPVAGALPNEVAFLCPVVAAVLVVVAGRVWRFAIRHYRSTGS